MIIYVDSKSGKVDLTKKQLEELLKEKYNEGYEAGKKTGNICSCYCPYGYNYWGCPHRWSNKPYITWTSSGSATSGYCSDNITTFSDSTTTASSNIPSTATQASTTSSNVTIKYQEV